MTKKESKKKGNAPGRRVLVVEDNVDAAETLQLLLRMSGYETRAAYEGASAVAMVRDFKPSVVLLDIGLPDRDGYDVARELRTLPEMKSALLVALTGYGEAEDREKAERAGFDTFQVKPVEPERLEALLEDHFKMLASRAS